jgi:hypothetical protein
MGQQTAVIMPLSVSNKTGSTIQKVSRFNQKKTPEEYNDTLIYSIYHNKNKSYRLILSALITAKYY